ncbi:MAG: bifunctional diguanylate cyclase/phosphodiesterase [Acidobacteria bacterium]|nr:bifunctional diguanylate cyclase/phosphodiesterase [Acidobacteriota bacterium]
MIRRWERVRKRRPRPRYLVIKDSVRRRVSDSGPFDDPTGFFTRAVFQKVLDRVVDENTGTERPLGLFIFDLDDFRILNDTHGVAAGDEYLRQLGKALETFLPSNAIKARIGGDEFAILLDETDANKARVFAEELARYLRDFAPVMNNRSLQMTASIGAAVFPDHTMRANDLILKAEGALREAKRKGRGKTQVFDPASLSREMVSILRGQTDRIRLALLHQRFVPYYQPIVDVATGKVVSAEVLCRLREEDGRICAPDTFMDAAERFGLVTAIDRLVISMAFDALVAQRKKLPQEFEISLNLSSLDFDDDALVADISRLARSKGIRPGRITFEITETAALRDIKRVQTFTAALAAEGFRFALDDFGMGFSSFRYLRDLPLATVKLDQSYIRSIDSQPANRVFVKGVSDICRGLKIRTVAEGVENHETLNSLKELGVERAQGYLFGHPVPDLPYTKP